jgi:hypothetical protein
VETVDRRDVAITEARLERRRNGRARRGNQAAGIDVGELIHVAVSLAGRRRAILSEPPGVVPERLIQRDLVRGVNDVGLAIMYDVRRYQAHAQMVIVLLFEATVAEGLGILVQSKRLGNRG